MDTVPEMKIILKLMEKQTELIEMNWGKKINVIKKTQNL